MAPLPRDHPRACGEHSSRCARPPVVCGIIPAHAGNTGHDLRSWRHHRDHPRACGEHSPFQAISRFSMGSSPRMRGTQGWKIRNAETSGIIPAHAGNTQLNTMRGASVWDHPRACGEHVAARVGRRRDLGIIPAHAGNTVHCGFLSWFRGDHPRACGEHSADLSKTIHPQGSSPRMRGTLHEESFPLAPAGIIPAHAGNTLRD